jgi:hypothetical protein
LAAALGTLTSNYIWQRAMEGTRGVKEVPYFRANLRDLSTAVAAQRWYRTMVTAPGLLRE